MELNEKRKCKCCEHSGAEPWHGTASGYVHHRCVCAKCREKGNALKREDYRKNPAARARARRSSRKWRLSNRDQVRAQDRERYWKNRDDELARNREYRRLNLDSVRSSRSEYMRANPSVSRRARSRSRSKDAATDAAASRSGLPWEAWEDRAVLEDAPARQVAEAIGRTRYGVDSRRRDLRKRAA